eukprot:CAMPEP_0115660390 /NCGR_PEP_ID=MMETSP0272-20121206/46224_1 /TAXON_ID=71861 /ORGANISM="Scrippsiella trochoidea, Strain CCMP3099" /LENGTH=247 /DNA_ID=CAMNT_0003098553 /DNA_START=101 /DNA_END=842 /DNA_ORIENTATION=-
MVFSHRAMILAAVTLGALCVTGLAQEPDALVAEEECPVGDDECSLSLRQLRTELQAAALQNHVEKVAVGEDVQAKGAGDEVTDGGGLDEEDAGALAGAEVDLDAGAANVSTCDNPPKAAADAPVAIVGRHAQTVGSGAGPPPAALGESAVAPAGGRSARRMPHAQPRSSPCSMADAAAARGAPMISATTWQGRRPAASGGEGLLKDERAKKRFREVLRSFFWHHALEAHQPWRCGADLPSHPLGLFE